MLDGYAQGYPFGAHARLQDALNAVCPSWGAEIGRWDDRTSWRAGAKDEATEEQLAAAQAVLDTFQPWGDASPLPAHAEPPELPEDERTEFTLEEFAVADGGEEAQEDEEGANAADTAHSSGPEALHGLSEPSVPSGFYPGIMPLRNELEDLRSDVIRAISDQKRMRLRIAMDPSRADFLSERFAEYNNAGALGIEPDEALLSDRNAFLAMQSQERAINAFAVSLEDAAATADETKLRAMHAGLSEGWPT